MEREPTEMERRVAGAIAVTPLTCGNNSLTLARAAIRAMMEPSPEMLDHGTRAFEGKLDDWPVVLRRTFSAMIDAASPP